jgi:hypothetical protein
VSTAYDKEIEDQIAEWRAYMHKHRALHDTDGDELEDHLRDQIADLTQAGLRADESFLIAVKRLGSLDELSREFAREHSERLWKQLVLASEPDPTKTSGRRHDFFVMLGCAVAAAIGIKIPAIFGLDWSNDSDVAVYIRNFSLFALVPLAAYFVWQRRVRGAVLGVLSGLFILGAVAANVYPLAVDSQSTVLTAIHLPLALWLVVGLAYTAGNWRSVRHRMDFIRFTGEWLIYFVLIAFGGGVLTGLAAGIFYPIGIDIEPFIESWLLPCGAVGAVVVAGWLVEAKQSVIENMAPVLTQLFTPLFAATLLAFLVAVLWTSAGLDVDRDVLIIFDLLLVVVLGLLLYAISARDPAKDPGLFDRLQVVLVASALAIDTIVLLAITGRITEWGFTPNKLAALGENVILLANLAWTCWLLVNFLGRRIPFIHLERWQTSYLTVYAAWAWTVVLIFPPVFNFA